MEAWQGLKAIYLFLYYAKPFQDRLILRFFRFKYIYCGSVPHFKRQTTCIANLFQSNLILKHIFLTISSRTIEYWIRKVPGMIHSASIGNHCRTVMVHCRTVTDDFPEDLRVLLPCNSNSFTRRICRIQGTAVDRF